MSQITAAALAGCGMPFLARAVPQAALPQSAEDFSLLYIITGWWLPAIQTWN